MLCDQCGEREAVVHLTQIIENTVGKLHLCERCAAERGVEAAATLPKHPLGEFLQAVQQQIAAPAVDSLRCNFCGMTLGDFRQTGRWGCSRCYVTFEQSMRDLLRRVHGSSRHTGWSYKPPQEAQVARTSELAELRERLRRAIEQEQFELAADLRDRIRVME